MRPRSWPRGLELDRVQRPSGMLMIRPRRMVSPTEWEKPMQVGAEDVDAAVEVASVASLRPKMVDRAGVGGCGAAADADATGLGGHLLSDRGTWDVFPLPRLTSPLPPYLNSAGDAKSITTGAHAMIIR